MRISKVVNMPTITAVTMLMLLSGCGKPAGSGGPPGGDMPTPAVVAKVNEQQVNVQLDLVAGLEPVDHVMLVAEIDAPVTEVAVKEGDAVEKGDILFRLDDVQTTAALKEAEASLRLAEQTHERNKDLLKKETISQQEFDESASALAVREAVAAMARDRHDKTSVSAPFDGVVGEKQVSTGQFVRAGEGLIDLISSGNLELATDVPERHSGSVQPGQNVLFETDAFAGQTFTGVVHYIAPDISEKSRTIRVKAAVLNSDAKLKPGMFGKVKLVVATRDNALVIPESAVTFSSAGQTVIRVNNEGRAEFVAVTTGERIPGKVEITSGLNAGDLVVIEGGQKMGPGSLVMASAESAAYGVTPGPLGSAPASEDAGTQEEAGNGTD